MVRRHTRISVETVIEPAVAAELTVGVEQGYSNLVSDACLRRVRNAGRPWRIAAAPGTLANDGSHIIIRQRIGRNARGRPYRIVLSARQGEARWSGSISRPFFRRVHGVPVSPDGRTPDGRQYWDVHRDVTQLAARLCARLVLPRSAR